MACSELRDNDLVALRWREIAFRTYNRETFIRSLELDCPMRFHVIPGFGSDVFDRLAAGPVTVAELCQLAVDLTGAAGVRGELEAFLAELYKLRLVTINGRVSERFAGQPAAKPDPEEFDACTYMYDYAYRNLIPFKVDLELTYRCNLNCRHCYASKDTTDELDCGELTDVLTALADLGCLELVMTGGECTLRPDFLEIVSAAKASGFAITVLTNGTVLEREMADELARHLPEFVSISFYGATADTHDNFTLVRGSFARSLTAAEILAERGVRVICTYVLNRHNADEVTLFRSLAEDKGLEWKATPLLFPTESHDASPLEHRVTDRQLEDIIRSGIYTPTRTICNTGRGRYRISPQGEVFPCELMRITLGNVRQTPLSQILSNTGALAEFRLQSLAGPEECRDCELEPHCPRCAGIVYLETGTLTGKFAEGCRIAAAHSRVVHEGPYNG